MGNSFISSFTSFELATQAVLKFLHDQIGFQLWMFTRVEGNDWIVLDAQDYGYNVRAGDVFKWSDSFCVRMVEGKGPRISSRCEEVAAYLEAPINQQVTIKSYIGMPLAKKDGSLFGTLCAIDPQPQPPLTQQQKHLIELQSQLLATILHFELQKEENLRRFERAQAEAQRDVLTGVYNRRGWETFLLAEESRCQKYGHSACVMVIDLDNLKKINDQNGHSAGDKLIKNAAYHLCETLRKGDIVARLGGDEFGILMIEIDAEEILKTVDRIQKQLEANNISASVGWAIRSHKSTLQIAVEQADKKMYEQKKIRKQLNNYS